MTNDSQKYNAEVLKISGFAMMSPFGRFFLQPLEIFRNYGLTFSICYGIISLSLLILGVIFVARGFETLENTIRKL